MLVVPFCLLYLTNYFIFYTVLDIIFVEPMSVVASPTEGAAILIIYGFNAKF